MLADIKSNHVSSVLLRLEDTIWISTKELNAWNTVFNADNVDKIPWGNITKII